MYIRKRKGRYSVSIRRVGAKAINKTFAKKSDAHKFGIDIELQLQRKRYKDTSNASKTTLKSVLERHLTERMSEVREPKKEQSRFNTICKSQVVDKYLIDLTPNDFAQFRDARSIEGAAGATIIRELSFMSVAIRKAIKIYGCWIPEHPIPNAIKPKEAPPRNRRLNEGEHNLLKEYCQGAPKYKKPNPYWCDAIDFAIESALRLNEQLTLTWKNISIEKKVMTILAKHTKTGVQRVDSHTRENPKSTLRERVVKAMKRDRPPLKSVPVDMNDVMDEAVAKAVHQVIDQVRAMSMQNE